MEQISADAKEQIAIAEYRQHALFVLGVSAMVLWLIPHPHAGVYELLSAGGRISGGNTGLDMLRWIAGFFGWASVVVYLYIPRLVRRQTS